MKEQLKKECAEIGVVLSDKQCEQFINYYELLIEWNKKINLTRITQADEVVTKHFVDSLTLLKYCNLQQKAKVVDIGTGAGFPGVPLKIVRPDIRLTLLDSLNKRLVFLSEVCTKIGIEAELVHARAEDGAKNSKYREKYDLSVSRAVARLNTLSEYCLPYVKVGGMFTAMKGPDLSDEIDEAKNAVKTLGGEIKEVTEFELKDSGRTIVVINKIKQTPITYPRHSGKIKSKSL